MLRGPNVAATVAAVAATAAADGGDGVAVVVVVGVGGVVGGVDGDDRRDPFPSGVHCSTGVTGSANNMKMKVSREYNKSIL